MTTQKTLSLLKIVLLGIVLSVGLSYAATWTGPSASAPAGNIDVPINAGRVLQEKQGGLSVNAFAALGDAQLKQQAFIRGSLKGIDPGAILPTLEIGGTSTTGSTQRVATTVNGNWNSGQTIGATDLKNTTLNRLCSDDTGHVVLCTYPDDVISPSGPVYYASCFIADTMVTLADGSKKKIQDVKMGDVLKGDTTNNTVLGFHQPTLGDNKLYSFNGGEYFVTAEHPFLTTKGWKSIDPSKTMKEHLNITITPLKVGDVLITDAGLIKIKTIDSKAAPASTQLYNFVLSGDHTYFADGYLVHNKTQALPGTPYCNVINRLPCLIPSSADGIQLNPDTLATSCSGVAPICPTGTSSFCDSRGIKMCR